MVGIEESGPVVGFHNQKSVGHSCLHVHAVSNSAVVLPTLRTRLAQRPKSSGAPTLIFIAGAALRVADVTRILKDKKLRGEKGGDVAKLFAKHIKLEEHMTFLRRTKLSAAAGTPGRLGKLLESGDICNPEVAQRERGGVGERSQAKAWQRWQEVRQRSKRRSKRAGGQTDIVVL